tara:strand:+ start:789 stop:1199 length:411 start_codon:yes stop_codon:yes gene_type:complete
MAKLPYSWNKVGAGDIISFAYKSSDGRRLRRTILVLEPKRKNLIHGIQLEVSNKPTNTEIKKILESAGTTQIVDGDKKIYRVILDGTAKQTYTKMKTLIKRHGIYRTYSYDKAKKSTVFLEDLRLPVQFVKELNEN